MLNDPVVEVQMSRVVRWSSPGDILRWWRTDVLGLSQQQVADRLSVKATALSNWENGNRAISIDHDQVDRALGSDGVLGGLLWAFGTPEGLEPNQLWTKVFPGDPTPVWLWIRSSTPKVRLTGEWGIARVECDLDVPPNGVFLTVAHSVAESPIVVHLSEPCWADFGRGDLPDRIPGATIMPAIDYASRSGGSGTFYELFFGNLGDRFSRSRSGQLAGLSKTAPRSLAGFFARFTGGAPGADSSASQSAWPPLPAVPDDDTRLRYARLRQARQLSLVDTVRRLAALSEIEVSKDTLRRFETGVGEPHDRLLPAALDQVLGADGNLATLELRADEGSGAVRVPSWWFGPMWFEFTSADRGRLERAGVGKSSSDRGGRDPVKEVTVSIHWGDWSRDVTGRLPLRLAYHHSAGSQPLRVTAAPDVAWRVGIGRRSGATPINHGWSPTSVDTVQRAMAETEEVIFSSLERRAAGWTDKRTADSGTTADDDVDLTKRRRP